MDIKDTQVLQQVTTDQRHPCQEAPMVELLVGRKLVKLFAASAYWEHEGQEVWFHTLVPLEYLGEDSQYVVARLDQAVPGNGWGTSGSHGVASWYDPEIREGVITREHVAHRMEIQGKARTALARAYFYPAELEAFGALEWTQKGASFCLGNDEVSATWSELDASPQAFISRMAEIADRWGLEYIQGRYTL